MIISDKHRFIFMCIPKTATMMMEQILKPYGGVYHNGQPWARHPNRISSQYKDYFTFCMIRNPYSRAVSLWFSAITSYPKFKYGIVETYGKEFMPFLEMLTTPRVNGQFNGLPMVSMSSFLENVKIDSFLRFENLRKDIVNLPFWEGDAPTFSRNVRGHLRPHWSLYYRDSKRVECVRQWAKKDFEQFGYSVEIPTDKNSLVDKTLSGNSPCICGSGKQFHHCCDKKQVNKYLNEFYI